MTDPLIGIEDDKQKKTELMKRVFAEKAASSSVELFQRIDRACKEGGKIEAVTLSGGYTNYSYKLFVPGQPDLAVFAKLSFEYALWNPDKNAHYDLQRTVCEYEVMSKMAEKTPECVVAPLACYDIEDEGQKMKLLVTEWSKADEQLCNQFIDGAVDSRIAPKLASTLATLHTIDFDPDFNEQVKPCMLSLFDQMIAYVKITCEELKPKDRTEKHMVILGSELMLKTVEANLADYNTRDCLIHSDSHAFNIIVEAKPSIEELENFGPNGNFVLVDWEMCMAGPKGRDVGLALSFPIGCMVAHALGGHLDANESINAFIISLLDSYAACMSEAGKSPGEVASIIRNVTGWAGWFQFLAFYFLDVQMVDFPCETEHDRKYVKDAMGVLGLKLLRLSYDTDYFPEGATTEQVKNMFLSLVEEEVTETAHERLMHRRRRQPRKSSMLRATNRRVSDAMLNFSARELSITE
ncbi:protein kinase-like domain superfamily protein [Skeletonema marinoi]|uniref:Protein kinase-like domain superfamily protein n=1 Tax=Skeletonema marinoi TaxID=267567 RepID=A0AAD8YF38_9STRA|nr:protein kinase-like domain superfamily protein [Skeletonema marinoi]